MNKTRREFLAAVPVAIGAASLAAEEAPRDSDLTLRFDQPAREWSEALPLGNGRLGAMVFGGAEHERLQLNEDTLWSGYPRNCNNPDAREHLTGIRKLVLQQADYVAADQAAQKMQGPFNQSYQPLADLAVDFSMLGSSTLGEVTNYTRTLDLDTAIANVRFQAGGSTFTRETFVSAVDQVIAIRIMAREPARLRFAISLSSQLQSTTAPTANGREILLTGKAPAEVVPNYWSAPEPVRYDPAEGHGMRFAVLLQLRNMVEGSVISHPDRIEVTGARSCEILISAATGYRGFDSLPDRSADEVLRTARAPLNRTAQKSWARPARRAPHRTSAFLPSRLAAARSGNARSAHHTGAAGRHRRSR